MSPLLTMKVKVHESEIYTKVGMFFLSVSMVTYVRILNVTSCRKYTHTQIKIQFIEKHAVVQIWS